MRGTGIVLVELLIRLLDQVELRRPQSCRRRFGLTPTAAPGSEIGHRRVDLREETLEIIPEPA
jgi:hypothetical protein